MSKYELVNFSKRCKGDGAYEFLLVFGSFQVRQDDNELFEG